MLVAQAVYSEKIWGETTGGIADGTAEKTADCENKIRAVLGEVLKRETNISLVGMPGAGKTTVGRILAEKLGMGFRDTDEEIEKIAGMPIDHSFLTYKKNLERFGWKVAKIAMKCGNVTFEKIK